MDRREFIKSISMQGAWLAVGFNSELPKNALQFIASSEEFNAELNPFILISSAGRVTLVNHKPEMGQGTFQSIPALIAEELEVDAQHVDIVQGGGDGKYGYQTVGGSGSIRFSYTSLRQIAATAREMLRHAAAKKWQVNVEACIAENGTVRLKDSSATLHYGELVEEARKIKIETPPDLKTPDQFKVLGKSQPRKDIAQKVNGSAKFGIDIKVPNMLYATVERAPVYQAKVISFDQAEAARVAGVKNIFKTEKQKLDHPYFGGVTCNEGVAVVADSLYAATTAKKLLKIEWSSVGTEGIDLPSIYATFKEQSQSPGRSAFNKGDETQHRVNAASSLAAEYLTPFIAHCTLEPQNATAFVEDDRCTIWAPTQIPDIVQAEFAKILNLPLDRVTVNVTFIGGGFGRRLLMDFILEAVTISKHVGAPVKVIWTREDDLTQGPFRPGALNQLSATVINNTIGSLTHKVIVPNLTAEKELLSPAIVTDGINRLYQIPNYKIECVTAPVSLQIGAFRSVYASTNTFAHECFMDEIIHCIGADAFACRRSLLSESTRYLKLLDVLEDVSEWKSHHRRGRGMAVVNAFGSFCGHVVYLQKVRKQINIEKVIAVIDCGVAINPDNIKAQLEGGIVMALSACIKNGITFTNGKVDQQNFDSYKLLRFSECPVIETFIIKSSAKPGGVGEVGFPSVAPALVNAIADLTGRRIRQLPFDLSSDLNGQ